MKMIKTPHWTFYPYIIGLVILAAIVFSSCSPEFRAFQADKRRAAYEAEIARVRADTLPRPINNYNVTPIYPYYGNFNSGIYFNRFNTRNYGLIFNNFRRSYPRRNNARIVHKYSRQKVRKLRKPVHVQRYRRSARVPRNRRN